MGKKEKEDEVDLSIGGVPLGGYLRASSRWAIVTTTAAIISAIAAVVSVVLLLVQN